MTINPSRILFLSVALSLYTAISLPSVQAAAQRNRNFTASTDASGHPHPAKADINANGVITCTAANGKGQPACYVETTAGGSQALQRGQTMGTASGGTMTLTCNGTGPLSCSVNIGD